MAKQKARRARRSFAAEFKADAVRLCQVGDRSAGEVAKDLDLTETALREWLKRAEDAAAPTPRGGAQRDGARRAQGAAKAGETPRDGARYPKKSDGLLRQAGEAHNAPGGASPRWLDLSRGVTHKTRARATLPQRPRASTRS
ncbi:MAG: transposase [Myxococcales bacterium]|nr:transposase [Myxococcales bacterium]